MLRVGLTGGIASGKSTVRRIFDHLGCETLDADALVAELYEPGRSGYEALLREYGEGILDGAARIDRAKLSAIAFATPEAARRLNALIHPIVLEEIARAAVAREAEGARIFVVEATLLLESGGKERFDRIVVVDVPPEIQLERATARGLSADEARRRASHQMARQERLRHADYVIDNRGDREALERATEAVYAALQRDVPGSR